MFVCGAGESPPHATEAPAAATAAVGAEASGEPATPLLDADLIEQLGAIGYLAGTEPATELSGVIRHNPLRAAPGFNLLTSGHGPVAQLMDMDGKVVHEWRAEFADVFPGLPNRNRNGGSELDPHRNFWRDAVLFPNGDILVIWELFGLFKLDRHSRVLWAVAEPVHHDLQLTPTGEVMHLQAKRKMIAGIPEQRAIEDFIVTRDADGKELRRLAMSDALGNADWLGLRQAFWARANERGYGLTKKGLFDPFHTNSLWLLTATEAARLGDSFRAGDALVSMAMLDTIAILDMEKGVTRWWQQGPFGMQHQPHPTPGGEIILFNNFHSAERSKVVILDPQTRKLSWEYGGPESAPLHSRRSGRVQVLPNGNVLIVETDGGRVLELTVEGDAEPEVVWEFKNPYRTGKNGELVAALYSLDRVEASQVEWLGR